MRIKKMDWMIFLLLIFITGSAQESSESIGKTVMDKAPRAKLQIDDGEGMMTSYAEANRLMANKYFGLKDRLNSRRWCGYNGTIRISESRFFEIAGFPEETRMASRYQSIRQGVFWTGTGMAILGLLIGAVKTEKNDDEWHVPAFGIGLFATGIAIDMVWYFVPANWNTLGTALNAVDKYNQRE